ncbi:ATP-binding response regulator [Methanogenium organophilum]|uniref:histidine kinase n=1 Tax=Methanogenium organophilum TaxID=2199 RepID=A0A9X9S269_METOG|nr:hybrid sensor histidine kinase/response regulator [Methanogenium organophilum]WAI00434.1 ATP-binding protein [Methanogenium organophilum]
MKLQTRVLVVYLCIAVMVIALVGIFLPVTLNQQSLDTVTGNTNQQLALVDYSLSGFISSMKGHVLEISLYPVVRNPDDESFTNFLNADEDTFAYAVTEEEQEIITIFNSFRTTNQYVNSVYMGRENGAFVRSHERAQPTAYDPRERPWYILAAQHPDSVIVTEPYSSLTTQDVNIGVVKALLDENGTVYGVVGADITLTNMTDYVTGFDPGWGGEIIIVDTTGVILSGQDPSYLFMDIGEVLHEKRSEFMDTDSGTILLNGNYLIYYTSPELGWKLGMFIPASEIQKETNEAIFTVLTYLFAALILLSAFSLYYLRREIIRPLSDLTDVSRTIAETGDLDQEIPLTGTDEIGVLARSLKDMVERLHSDEVKLNEALKCEREAQSALKVAHDELEEKVSERTRELAEVNEHLKELDRLKSMFIATMSHELRTPLNSIIGFSGILLKGWSGDINEEQIKQLTIIDSSARHLLGLINDVIDISKIEAGTIELSLSSYDLVPVISDVLLSFRESANEQKIALYTDIPETLEIFGDERRTKQILINLIGNAFKFTDGGSVTVTAGTDGDTVHISVTDTGIGIPEGSVQRLFKPFIRVRTEGRMTEGTGLGLYLSRKLARALGGEITVASSPGEGSEFTVILPLESENIDKDPDY